MEFEPHEREIFRLRSGDLVVAEASGSADKVGKPAIWNDELPLCCFQNTVIRLRPYLSNSRYVLVLLRHCYLNGVFANLSDGMGINHLGAGRLARIAVPLAPQLEQQLIVEEVERQLESARQSQQAIDSNLLRAKNLRNAVYSQAFRGDLVNPKSSEEDAVTLLDRISVRRIRDSLASKSNVGKGGAVRMKPSSTRKSLLEVIMDHPNGITPEALFAAANYTVNNVDQFYSELSQIADQVLQEKPGGADAETWPRKARVLLRLKKEA